LSKSVTILFSHLLLGFLGNFFLLCFPIKTLYEFLSSRYQSGNLHVYNTARYKIVIISCLNEDKFSLCLIVTPRRRVGEWRCISTILDLGSVWRRVVSCDVYTVESEAGF
jgi:hypothetical protein